MPESEQAFRTRRRWWPWVRRSVADDLLHDVRLCSERRAALAERYETLWLDHIAHCDCHDSWNQCPCSEVGHKTPIPEGRTRHDCQNACCRWCG